MTLTIYIERPRSNGLKLKSARQSVVLDIITKTLIMHILYLLPLIGQPIPQNKQSLDCFQLSLFFL